MTTAEELKAQGNRLLGEKKYSDAELSYTAAIELDPNNAIYYANRAAVHIKMENYGYAIADADKAIELDPENHKAHFRKGVASMAILDFKKAQKSFKDVLALVPDKTTKENLKVCTTQIRNKAFHDAIAGDDKVSILQSIDYDSLLIEKSYTGPSLEVHTKKNDEGHVEVEIEGLDSNYLKSAITLFKNGGQLPKKHVFAIIAKVQQILKKENTLNEITLPHSKRTVSENTDEILLTGGKKLTVVGDTHGQFYDVMNLFQKFGFVSNDHIYLINGDFVDRGSWSCEVALYYYILKILYPKSFFINRGNHETDSMNKSYGFSDECEAKYNLKVYDAFSESFGALPLATLINQSYLVMHGGLFSDDTITLQDIKKVDRLPSNGSTQPPRDGIAMELLWTDPQPENGRSPSKRGLGVQFGPDITERFCLSNKIRKVLRSHETRDQGVEIEHNGRLITVFSAPNYCDASGNLGGVVHITENKNYDEEKDDGEGYRIVDDPNCPWDLELARFEHVPHPDIKPMAYSKGFGY